MAITQITYDDVDVGMTLEKLQIGPWTVPHIVRWCAAQENWERQHTDYKYATEHDGLPNVIANGGWRKHIVARLFREWAGHGGWLWKLFMSYTAMHFPGDTFDIWAKVSKKYELEGMGFVELEGGMRNQKGQETTPTLAIVVLPFKKNQILPLPFVPPPTFKMESPFRKGSTCARPKYVTDEVKAYIGKETEEVESVDEICKSELRRFSQAIPDLDPIYWDTEYAKGTRFKTIVAPPLFPVDAFKQPPNLPDRLTEMLRKDPDFQGGPPWDRRLIIDLPLKTKLTSNINGGQEFEILNLAYLGEKLRARRKILDIYEKESKTFGRAVYRIEMVTYKNSKGEVIMRAQIALIYR